LENYNTICNFILSKKIHMSKIVSLLVFISLYFSSVVQAQFQFAYAVANKTGCAFASDGNICWTLLNGTAPYYIDILGTTVSTSSYCAQNLSAGTYTITATDVNNTSTSTIVTVGVNTPSLKIIASDTILCDGDTIFLSPMFNSNSLVTSNAYCTPIIAGNTNEDINNVTFGSINNTTSCTDMGGTGSELNKYNIYTDMATTILPGATIPFSISIGNCNGGVGTTNSTAIFIDYNADGDFLDLNELAYISPSASTGAHIETGFISTPNVLYKGITRMRVLNVSGQPSTVQSCGSYSYGEVEDYTIFLNAAPASIFWECNVLSTVDTTLKISSTLANTFTLTVDYGNGCLDSTSININVFTPPSVTILPTNIGCANASLATAVTGNSPFQYTWLPTLESTSSITNLINGTYSLNVTDSNGCFSTTSYNVTLTPSMASTPAITNVACFGDSSGAINLNFTGGTPPYNYVWIPAVSNITNPINLKSGAYSLMVTDANNCTYNTSVVVTQPASAIGLILSSTNATYFGATDGSAKVIASGGAAPYTYLWAPTGSINDSLKNVGAATYSVTVTDANGCTTVGIVVISQPNGLENWNAVYQLQIYPNPTNEFVEITSAISIENLVVSNAQGQVMIQQKPNKKNAVINASNLPNGIYMLQINNVLARKIIVQHP
jgi:large repetitive protein